MSILVTGGAGYIGSHTAVIKCRKRDSNNRQFFKQQTGSIKKNKEDNRKRF